MYNLFVWILLLGYAPSKTSEDEETTPIRREQELLAVRPAREYQASNVSGYRHPPPLYRLTHRLLFTSSLVWLVQV